MQTIVRTLIILAASLLVAGATYAVGQTEWASQQDMGRDRPPPEYELENQEDGSREGVPNFHAAAEILGITEDELMSALDGFPPNVEAASEALGMEVAQIEAALEEAGTQEEHGHEAEPFGVRSLLDFVVRLLQIGFVIALVTWVPKGIQAIQRRTAKSSAS